MFSWSNVSLCRLLPVALHWRVNSVKQYRSLNEWRKYVGHWVIPVVDIRKGIQPYQNFHLLGWWMWLVNPCLPRKLVCIVFVYTVVRYFCTQEQLLKGSCSLCGLHIIMVTLWNRADHYIFMLLFVLLSFFFFSSPNLSRLRLDVCHTSRHGVAFKI